MSPDNTPYQLCQHCNRHIRADGERCPFCDGSVGVRTSAPSRSGATVMLAVTAALSGISFSEQSAGSTHVQEQQRLAQANPRLFAQASPASGYGAAPMNPNIGVGTGPVATVSQFSATGESPAEIRRTLDRIVGQLAGCVTPRRGANGVVAPPSTDVVVDFLIPRGTGRSRPPTLRNAVANPMGWAQNRVCLDSVIRGANWPLASSQGSVRVHFRFIYGR